MTTYIALLRAVNVGGTGKLSMADLKATCVDVGFDRVETYIASGNVVFDSGEAAGTVESRLEERLLAYAGRPVSVLVRTAEEMQRVLDANPFADKEPNRTFAPPVGRRKPDSPRRRPLPLRVEKIVLCKQSARHSQKEPTMGEMGLERAAKMRPATMILGICAVLTGCYTPSQSSWNQHVHSWIRVGMPFASAIAILGTHGLSCTGGNPTSCDRTRGGLLTCGQKVVVRFQEPEMLVDSIEIPMITCIGGF